MNDIPAMHNLARWLIAREAAMLGPSETAVQAAVRVCERLRGPLSTLAGAAGYRALIGRALALTKAEAPPPGAVHVSPDGRLEVSGSDVPERDADRDADWGAALVARLLGLLVTFIGETLTMRLVHDVWPDAPLDGIDPKTEKL